jgi:small conductance mechanosensitive channel
MNLNFQKALDIVSGKLESWMENIITMLPNAFVAVLIMILFFFLAKLIRQISKKILGRISGKGTIDNLFANIIYLFVVGIGLVISLNVLHLEQTVTSLLAGAGIIGLALSFAFQDISANLISGVILAFRKPIMVGDIIQFEGYTGVIEEINMRATLIKTFQGLHVIIPNRHVLQNPITNFTKTSERRIDLEVGISYAEDLEFVKEITLNAVRDLPYLLPDKEVNLFYNEFADSSINFTVMIWVHYPDEPGFLKARSDVIMAIKKAYNENHITIPFPIRTLDFGIKGGRTLSEMKLRAERLA